MAGGLQAVVANNYKIRSINTYIREIILHRYVCVCVHACFFFWSRIDQSLLGPTTDGRSFIYTHTYSGTSFSPSDPDFREKSITQIVGTCTHLMHPMICTRKMHVVCALFTRRSCINQPALDTKQQDNERTTQQHSSSSSTYHTYHTAVQIVYGSCTGVRYPEKNQ